MAHCRLHRQHPGPRGQSPGAQRLGRADQGRRAAPAHDEREGRRRAMVARRQTPRLRLHTWRDSQMFLISLVGGEATPFTSLSGGADNIVWSPDGATLAFTSRCLPRLQGRGVQRDAREGTGRQSSEGARLRPAALPALDAVERRPPRTSLRRPGGRRRPKDLTPGADYDVPPVQREGPHPIAFSPDGTEIAFVAVTDTVEATSTNGDIFTVSDERQHDKPKATDQWTGIRWRRRVFA